MAFNCGDVGDVANVPVSIPVSDSDLRDDHIPPGRKREIEREREKERKREREKEREIASKKGRWTEGDRLNDKKNQIKQIRARL